MDKKIIEWENTNPLIGPSYWRGNLNSIHIFTICRSLVCQDVYEVKCTLPGMRMVNMGGNNVEACKCVCEEALDVWLNDAGLSKINAEAGINYEVMEMSNE